MSGVRSAPTIEVRDKSDQEKEAIAELVILNGKITEANTEIKRLEGLKVALADDLQKLESDKSAKVIEYNSILAQIKITSDDLASINTSVNSLTAEESSLKERIETFEIEYQNKIRSLNAEYQQNISDNNIELQKVSKELLDARQSLVVLQSDVTNVTSKKDALETSFNARLVDLTNLTEDIVVSTQTKESLDSAIKSLEAQNDILEAKISNLDIKISDSNKVLFGLTEDISRLTIEKNNLIESNKVEMDKIDQEKFAISNREKLLEIQTEFIKNKYVKAGVQWNP